jgi:hypothetical protein
MTRARTLSGALVLVSSFAASFAACGVDDGTVEGGDGDNPGGGVGIGDGFGETHPGTGPDVADDDTEPTYPTAHPRIYLGVHKERLQAALAANTRSAATLKSTADRWVGGANIYNFPAWSGALLGQLTGEDRYCTKAIAEIEKQVTAAEAKIAARQRPDVAANSYLHVGEMLGDLALVYDWCFDQVSQSQRSRWIAYANQTLSNLWGDPDEATWGGASHPWLGWSVDNPRNNYYYSFLRATMLVGLATKGENPRADEWISEFRDKRIYGQLIPVFEEELVGGGSREGTGYGVSLRGLFELYNFWTATTGENLATKTKHARASLLAFIHQVMPTLDKVAPYGDHARDMKAALFDYHRHYLQTLIALFPDDPLAGRAKQLLADSSVPRMGQPFMQAYDFLYDFEDVAEMPLDGLETSYFARGIGELSMRSGWDKGATWVGLKAGPYTEDHAHQDQGSLMIYKGGWLAYDGVIDSNNGLPQGTNAHGLVRITSGGQPVKQIGRTTSKMEALQKGDGWVYAAADLTPSYNGHAAVQKVHREMVYLQPDAVIVFDRVQTGSGTTQTWQLATPVQPSISGNTATISNAGHQLKVTRLAPTSGALTAYSLSRDSEFRAGFRLDEQQSGGDVRYLHVLSLDGAVTSAQATGDAARPGATVTLSDGRTVTVSFDRDAIGGTLTIDGTTIALEPTAN